MCYWIEQTAGVLDDTARALDTAVRAGDMATAQRIYTGVTGEPGSQPANHDNCWWLYNAAGRIRSHTGFGPEAVEKFAGREFDMSDRHYFEAKAALATRKLGGTWRVLWEY